MRNRTNRPPVDEVQRHVPLRAVAFAVLAPLAEGPRPGIDILDGVNGTVPRRRLLGPGTLYRLMRELRSEGLIARAARAAGVSDERQAHHALTPLGQAVLRAEVARLERTIRLATALPSSTGR